MLALVRRRRIEALLALVAIVVLYYGAQALLSWSDARAAYRDALETQQELEAEAAQYNIDALTRQRNRLQEAASAEAFPLGDEVELRVGNVVTMLRDPRVELGPVVIGEVEDDVTDEDVDGPGGGARTYQAVEMSLSLNGSVTDLLDLAERVLAAVPGATFQDVSLTLPEADGPSTLQMRILLYYKD